MENENNPMLYTIHIDDAVKDFDLANNVKFLNVTYSIIDENDDTVAVRKEAFPFDTSEEDIMIALQKQLAVFADDIIKKRESQAIDELEAQADDVIDAIKGEEIALEPEE